MPYVVTDKTTVGLLVPYCIIWVPGAIVLAKDVGGGDFTHSIYYHVFGPVLPWIFYGALLYSVLHFWRALKRPFISIDGDKLRIGGKEVMRSDVKEVETIGQGRTKKLKIMHTQGEIEVRGYLIKKDVSWVAATIRSWLTP